MNTHQLAGHVANMEFWADEVAHCLRVIDQYNARFERLSAGQSSYVSAHNTIEFSPHDPCCTERPAARPKRVAESERHDARRDLCDAYYRFVLRCHKAGFIDETAVRTRCDQHDISVEQKDLQRT